jgi:hypothetical protein
MEKSFDGMESSFKDPKRLRKRVALGIVLALAAAALGLGLWLALPPERIQPALLLPSKPFAYFTLRLDREDPAMREIFARIEDRLTSRGSFPRRLALSVLLPGALPPSLSAAMGSDPSGGEAALLVYADLGRLSKVLRLAGDLAAGSLLGGEGPIVKEVSGGKVVRSRAGDGPGFAAYAVVGGTLVLGTSRAAIVDCCARYAGKDAVDGGQAAWSASLEKATSYRGAYLYADNRDGSLSRLVNAATARYSFAAFPSIDSVASINGTILVLEGEIKGRMTFASTSGEGIETIASDVRFIYGAAKRVARSAGLKLQGEILEDGGKAVFDFSLPGYMEALSASEEKQ